MKYLTHRHHYRLIRRWSHPDGYVFHCARCTKSGLYSHKFVRFAAFWGAS